MWHFIPIGMMTNDIFTKVLCIEDKFMSRRQHIGAENGIWVCKEAKSEDLGFVQLATGRTSVSDLTAIGKLPAGERQRNSLLSTGNISYLSTISSNFSTRVAQVSQLDSWRLRQEGCGYFFHQPKFFFSITGRLKAAVPQEKTLT